MPLPQYPQLQTFFDYLKFEKRYSQHTILSYQNDLEQFFAYLTSQFDAPPLKDITAMFVRSWLAEMKDNKISSKTINRKISSLKSFFKYEMRIGILEQTPMTTVVAPKISKRLPVFVDQKDMATLFDYVEFPDNWKGRTERLVLRLFYHTGMRLSELIHLKESQLDPSHSQLKVLGKGNKERIIPVSADLMEDIQRYISEKPMGNGFNTTVFVTEKGKPLQSRSVYAFVKYHLAQVTTIQKKKPTYSQA